ncbi:MAG TPA: hypothetical protein GXZ76_06500 [Clostridiaceae bacterium]|jgi:ribosomal protein S27E|nr:hypothetical protein [Clostridiaceae bacterium]
MNPFLTSKVKERSGGRIVYLGFCAFMELIIIMAIINLLIDENWGAALLALLFVLGFARPIVREIIKEKDFKNAKAIASYLNGIPSESIKMAQINQKIPINDPVKQIDRLLKKEYLMNIHLDWEKDLVVLLALGSSNRYVEISCPNCGAKTVILQGRVKNCEYCGGTLLGKKSE